MKLLCLLTLCVCFVDHWNTVHADGKTPRCSEAMEGEIKLDEVKRNSSCGFDLGVVLICTLESPGSTEYLWKVICDEDWTEADAQVACRQLDYSTVGATTHNLTLSISPYTSILPQCQGGEPNITSCASRNTSLQLQSCGLIPGVQCFLNDSAVSICFDTSVPTTTPETTEQTNSSTDTPTTPSSTGGTTLGEGTTPTDFLTSPGGIGIIVVVVIVIIFALLLLLVIVLLVCKKSSSSKQSRISPQNNDLEDSLKFKNSPEQSRKDKVLDNHDHHYLEHADPLYEAVKDVNPPITAAPPSVSSHDSGRSTTTADSDQLPTYSTLEQNQEMPTYSTLERGQADYAQVQPFINGSLPRGVTLVGDPNEQYNVLDRSTSQTSNFSARAPPGSVSPKSRAHRLNSSPKLTARGYLPSITDNGEEAPPMPVYAVLESPDVIGDVGSVVSNAAVVSRRLSPGHGARYSPSHSAQPSPGYNHQQFQHFHSNSLSGRPTTHEQVTITPTKKSSTLPHTSRSGPSLPPNKRWSGSIEPCEHSRGLNTSLNGRLTASNQERLGTNTWV